MGTLPILQERFDALSCGVIVPTYNNDHSLRTFLTELVTYTRNIIVINDGSTDTTNEILKDFEFLDIVSHDTNRGKGIALKTGFRRAEEKAYEYAITIDSDGQHYPADLEKFLVELENRKTGDPELLLVGDRNMAQAGIPGQSRKGNRFSSFWYLVVTAQELKDTQSGYRLYPVRLINSLRLITWKFELEIEVLVKSAWNKVEVKNIPIRIHYDPGERVTHFRPFWDIVRIVFLYMYFVLISFFYIHPRNKYREFKQKGISRFFREDIIRDQDSPQRKASAIALGIFVGISPFWGLHTLLVFTLATLMKVNKAIAFLFSNISIPPFIPLILYLSYQLGNFVMGNGFDWQLNLENFDSGKDLFVGLTQYLIGSIVLAIISAALTWILFYFLFSILKSKQPANN
ncbi:DUF2062 domain-containing protein [uncultured Christiangramia sp.]|uniref:DUF2062 domain-containing protein n=1 Tax=uncultured Christiangramia sp. TaxID=503836 RepID=UPI00260F43FA|nr:DUF2062 domain-containing protein [uncultured Christiangramia sp.]